MNQLHPAPQYANPWQAYPLDETVKMPSALYFSPSQSYKTPGSQASPDMIERALAAAAGPHARTVPPVRTSLPFIGSSPTSTTASFRGSDAHLTMQTGKDSHTASRPLKAPAPLHMHAVDYRSSPARVTKPSQKAVEPKLAPRKLAPGALITSIAVSSKGPVTLGHPRVGSLSEHTA